MGGLCSRYISILQVIALNAILFIKKIYLESAPIKYGNIEEIGVAIEGGLYMVIQVYE